MAAGCRLIVAAAGYGKTTALEAAGGYVAAPDVAGWGDLVKAAAADHIAVDDLCRLPERAQVRLARSLAALPDRVRVSLASSRPPAPAVLAALSGPVVERGPADLALGAGTVARVLRDEHGVADADVAYLVHDLTAGWPALVHFAGEALARRDAGRRDLLAALAGPGAPAARWLGDAVLAGLPAAAATLLDALVDLDPVTGPLVDLAAVAGPRGELDPVTGPRGELAPVAGRPGDLDPAAGARGAGTAPGDALRLLVRTGILTAHPRPARGAAESAYRLVPVVAATLSGQRRRGPIPDPLRAAATWYAGNGYPLAAARALHRAGDAAGCAALIADRGDEILAAGGAADLARLIDTLPAAARTGAVTLVHGDALRMAGEVGAARDAFAPLVDAATRTGRWAPELAWRAAMVDYLRGDHRTALDVLDRADAVHPDGPDAVLLAACRATVLVTLGEPDRAAGAAAHALAGAAGIPGPAGDRALAAAHLAAAHTTVGVRRDAHLADALAAAERAGDIVQQARILANQADCLLREARYPQALDVAARAVGAAEQGCPPGMLVAALHNAGEALTRLGRYDDAVLHFERSMRISRRVGLNRVAFGLYGLAEVHRQLGRREQSRAAFEEAADLSRAAAELQILVPALAGLARLLLDGAGADRDAARAAADEAVRVAPPGLAPRALVAAGWVALFDGDLAAAQRHAAEAVRCARAGRQADLIAESLELSASVSTEADAARTALAEAAAIWQRAGAAPAADQMLVLLGRVPGAGGADRLAARSAATRLAALGVHLADGSPVLPGEGATAPVRVRVLGRFEVLVGGRPVPLPAWKSRQARTLVKILVARRGRPVPRTELCELLWPDDEPHRTAHRLSVLLSVVRQVLDPAKRWPADHYVGADLAGLSLNLSRVTVDVEDLLRDAAHGVRLARDGDPARARDLLTDVDTAYRGDAFDDEPYEDWADGLREQARAGWLRALRELAAVCRRAGDLDHAATSLVRLLAADGYDEAAHRTLVEVMVAAGRHGEARRAFDRWTAAMRSIEVPDPDRAVLRRAG